MHGAMQREMVSVRRREDGKVSKGGNGFITTLEPTAAGKRKGIPENGIGLNGAKSQQKI
jgi:hypothetical protein